MNNSSINEKCCCVESFCHSPLYALTVPMKINEVKGAGGWGVQEVRDEDLCFSMTQRAGEGLEGIPYNTP